MPIFTYFAVAGSVMIALLFVADATLEKGSPAVVTSQYGLPKPWRPVVTSDPGTYVAPHVQTNPNNTQLDNYGTRGNINPYTGQMGTRNPRY
jgi:hypothetical protein